jgi:hypothetical protein
MGLPQKSTTQSQGPPLRQYHFRTRSFEARADIDADPKAPAPQFFLRRGDWRLRWSRYEARARTRYKTAKPVGTHRISRSVTAISRATTTAAPRKNKARRSIS